MKRISRLFVCVCGRSTVRLQEKRSDILVSVRHLRQEKSDLDDGSLTCCTGMDRWVRRPHIQCYRNTEIRMSSRLGVFRPKERSLGHHIGTNCSG